jgi:hypothetical protein
MLWGHDLGWWGFWVSLVALLSALPLGIIGTLIAPRLEDWWAARSLASVVMRMVKLESRLKDEEIAYKLISPTSDLILQVLFLMAIAQIVSGYFFIVIMAALTRVSVRQIHIGNPRDFSHIMPVLLVYLCVSLPSYIAVRLIIRFRSHHSPIKRMQLKNSIISLRKRLNEQL